MPKNGEGGKTAAIYGHTVKRPSAQAMLRFTFWPAPRRAVVEAAEQNGKPQRQRA
jgi:hypothetical protein